MNCVYSASTMCGSRPKNQDNMRVDSRYPFFDPHYEHAIDGTFEDEEFHLFSVCDGIGGEMFGDLASINALDALDKSIRNMDILSTPLDEIMLNAVDSSQKRVKKLYRRFKASGGTTMTSLAIRGREYFLLNIGDSPAYLYSRSKSSFRELSQCHDLHSYKKRIGMIPSLCEHSVLLFYLGCETKPIRQMIHTMRGLLSEGDQILLCTDGVSNAFASHQLQTMLDHNYSAMDIVNSASCIRGSDNCTAIRLVF